MVCEGFTREAGCRNQPGSTGKRVEFKYACWDPKGGDLCVNRSKSSESLMDDRTRVDVQIAGQTHVKGRKTHRTT